MASKSVGRSKPKRQGKSPKGMKTLSAALAEMRQTKRLTWEQRNTPMTPAHVIRENMRLRAAEEEDRKARRRRRK